MATPEKILIRTGQPPTPNGCRWCGIAARDHYQQYSASVGWHQHVQPTDRQRLDRMRSRRIRVS